MEAKDVRFQILINNSKTQLITNFFMWQYICGYSLKNLILSKKIIFLQKLFGIFSFKIDSTVHITLDLDWDLDLDPGFWPNLDPDSMYPTHFISVFENCKQNHLKFNHKVESTYQRFALFYFIQYYSPTVHKVQNSKRKTFLFICSFILCWIRIRNNNIGSGSRRKFRFRIQAKVSDPCGSGSSTTTPS